MSAPGEWASRQDATSLQLKRFSQSAESTEDEPLAGANLSRTSDLRSSLVDVHQQSQSQSQAEMVASDSNNIRGVPSLATLNNDLGSLAQQLANLRPSRDVDHIAAASALTMPTAAESAVEVSNNNSVTETNERRFLAALNQVSRAHSSSEVAATQRLNETTHVTPRLEPDLVPQRSSTPPATRSTVATNRGRLAPLGGGGGGGGREAAHSPATKSRSPTTSNATRTCTPPNGAKRDGRIKVIVRKRPFMPGESGEDCIHVDSPNLQMNVIKQRVDLSEYTETSDFVFDEVYAEDVNTERVHQGCAKELLDVALSGGSASCFAYGQTGSGKTYTMMGNGDSEKGLYLLGATDLFERITPNQSLVVSFYEIYCNSLFDLLNNRFPVVLREDGNRKVNICGLSWQPVTTPEELWSIINSGMDQRRTGSTSANERSSRSHAVMSIRIRDINNSTFEGTLNYVDLAGSERAADTANNERQTRLEGAEINKSLLALKECIRALDEKKRHVPFRGSRLTEVLRDSFTGNSKTVMIANVSPSSINFEHTANTLRYAFRVKGLSIASVAPSKARNAPRPFQVAPRSRSSASAFGSPARKDARGGGGAGGSDDPTQTPSPQRSPGLRHRRSPSGNRDNARYYARQKILPTSSAANNSESASPVSMGRDADGLPPLGVDAAGSPNGNNNYYGRGHAAPPFSELPSQVIDVKEMERKMKRKIMKQLQEDLSRELQQILDERDLIIANLRRENAELKGEVKRLRVADSSEPSHHAIEEHNGAET